MQEVIIGLCEELRGMNPETVANDEILNLTASYAMVFGGDIDAW